MPEGRFDLNKVIPPTRTDEPESILGGAPTRGFPDCCAVGNAGRFYCTGTLIAPTLVVTAKHCTGVTRVYLKGHDVNDPDAGEIIGVKQQIHNREADLRVLILEAASSVEPRHVAQGHEVRADKALLVGFGTIDFGGTFGYGEKRKVEVPIMSLGCDSADDADAYNCRRGTEIVAGHRGLNKDSCKGDSGGPLYIRSSEGGYHLLGATSRGIARPGDRVCGDGGIYVRVDAYLDWIREETGVDIEGPLA